MLSNWKILFVMTISKTLSRNSEGKFCGVLLAQSFKNILIILMPCILSIFVYMDSTSQVKSFILFGRFPSFFRSWKKCEVSLM